MREHQLAPCTLPHAALVGQQAIRPNPPISSGVSSRDAAEQGVGDGYDLHSDVARLALPGRRDGSVLAQDRGLVSRADNSP